MPQIETQVNPKKNGNISSWIPHEIIQAYSHFCQFNSIGTNFATMFSVDTRCVRGNVVKVYAPAVLGAVYRREVSRQVFKL